MMRLPTLLFIFIMTLLFSCSQVFAFDSTSDYNSANMSYPANSTISQYVVFNSAMQSGGTITFNVDAHAGGGRPLQHDTGNLKLEFYAAGGALLGTASTNFSANLLQMDAWSSAPGDNSAPWVNLELSTSTCGSAGSCANVAFMKVVMIGTDTSWWAGNYGPQWRIPSVTFNGGANILYNPEFGSYNGTMAQGWTSSSGWGACGTTSGSVMCTTTAAGVTVNMHSTGYDATGGTTSSPAGGYSSTLSASNPTGDPALASGGSNPPADPNTTVVGTSAGFTAQQTTTKNNAQTRRDSYWGNNIYIDQVGSNNNITIKQESSNNTIRGYTQQNAQFNGNNNTVDIRQGAQGVNGKNIVEIDYNGGLNNIKVYQDRANDGSQDTDANANHIARISVNGSTNTISSVQRNNLAYPEGHFVDINVTGSSNNVASLQGSDVGKTGFINIQGDSNVVNFNQSGNAAQYAEIKLLGNGHSVTLNQKDNAAHKATIDLTNNGAASTVSVVQQGTTPQSYSLQQTCVALPCGATITQGQ